MIGDKIYDIVEGANRVVGSVIEANIIAGVQYYSIIFKKWYIVDGYFCNDEYYLCDTHNPEMHLKQSSFQNLTLRSVEE